MLAFPCYYRTILHEIETNVYVDVCCRFSRPEVIELDTWPQLHFDGRLGQTPFRSPSPLSLENEQINEKFCKNDKVTVELINQSSPTAKFSGFVLHGKNTSTASSVSNQGK